MSNWAKSKRSFWFIQLGGWTAYGLAVVVISVPLRHERDYIAFRSAYVVSGFLGSFLIYAVCHSVWKRGFRLIAAVAWCVPTCLTLGFLCSAAAVWSEAQFGRVQRPFSWPGALAGTSGNCFLFLAWAAIYFGIKYHLALQQKQLQLAQSEALAHDAQLRALRYQLQPHFLFNALNTISTLVLDDHKQDARKMISRLAELLRNTIDAPDTHLVVLHEELFLVSQYLAIEQVRFGERLRVKIDHAPQASEAYVPRLLLQPLVENAIRHGIAPRSEGGEILISSSVDNDMLTIRVLNDCPDPAYPDATGNGRSGIGIANTRSRLKTLYGKNQHLKITRQPGKFEVTLSIPIGHAVGAFESRETAATP
jgi:Histidine kinase